MTLAELMTRWQSRREEYARLGVLLDGSKLAAEVLADLEALETADGDEELTLTDAAKECDMHPDSIGRAIREGRIDNCGRKNAPRVKRSDLATLTAKPSRRTQRTRTASESSSESSKPDASLPAITRDAIAGKLPRLQRG